MADDYATFFQKLDITRNFSSAELLEINHLIESRIFSAGEVIIEEGSSNDFFISSSAVRLMSGNAIPPAGKAT